ncbi:Alkyl hydroperoxide reductase C [BD1-7 clade bacterium]|uniref:Alkyl hydroperoxide reductase C n=1 Tax=BD1-7 clade bacterium TaxID=2029982 RepID=A0A5S9QVX0_9GAMM|nr:Alkyl hydroperoxide reductase C [BD1-7 clade bacterium]
MIASSKLQAGALFPSIELLTVQDELVDLGYVPTQEHWKLIVIYRGVHCPLCRNYLETLNCHLQDLERLGVSVIAASADSERKARQQVDQSELDLMLAYGLNSEQMQSLGLYISNPGASPRRERPFAEPGLFLINEEGHIQLVDISNSAYCRPAIPMLIQGIQQMREHETPVQGTYEIYAQI